MAYRLSPKARAEGHRLHVHDALGSTNAQALALAGAGEAGPLWIVAHRQMQGRGRRGSAWVSAEGNLAATLLLPVAQVAPGRVATLGFVAGLALVRALDDVRSAHPVPHPEASARSGLCEGGLRTSQPLPEGFLEAADAPPRADASGERAGIFRLKWPNDVLAGGKKIAGILLEAEGRHAVAVGFGVNVAAAPKGLPYQATALAELGESGDAQGLFEALTARFVETARIWNKGLGFSGVRERWLAHAAGIGGPVSVRLHGATLSGRHDGIDEGGRLIILAPDGTTHTVTAGEVHFGEAATAA